MITVEFLGRRKRYGGREHPRQVRAIILDEPFNGVSGLVECCNCSRRAVITGTTTEEQTQEIEAFAYGYICLRLPTIQDLQDALRRYSSKESQED